MHDAHAQSAASTTASSADSLPTSSASASTHAPTDTSHHPAARCECPRCGYDLSGAVAAWNHAESTSCPMRGTCSECGLEFAWGDVLNPEVRVPDWSFEHAYRLRWWRLLRTAFITLLPNKLWRQLQMFHPIRGRRLVPLALCGSAVVHLAISAAACGLLVVLHLGAPPSWSMSTTDYARLVIETCWPYNPEWGAFLLPMWAGSGANDVPSLMSAWTLLVWLWWLAVPFAYLFLPTTLRRCRVRRVHLARLGAYSVVFASAGVFLGAASAGVFREAIYLVCAVMDRWLDGYLAQSDVFYRIDDLFRHRPRQASPFACFLLIFLFWGFGASRYLRLPRPWLVALVLTLLAGLLATALLALWPGFLQALFS